ncbi:hypothetical protein CANARDRAFT_61558 [[Candida] arabinofermentans NRRL YB-2248]|uniref:B30.2/SPRY domain-containing protein n=1 Tax=[Candida] arabinofermentans NRRL YB-2248 TaxID=983967 RepID=A0A1E4SYR4_9ASCO|nr:hypothetical protein CANARDRAFT_61558 [[Candida] arabinofermentans NRRL YB-2248]
MVAKRCTEMHRLLTYLSIQVGLFPTVINAGPLPTSKNMQYIVGMAIGFSLIMALSIIVFAIHKFIRGRIMLTNDVPGSIDDSALEAEEDRRALDELPPNEQELYFLAKDFLKLNPMNNLELALSQSLIIQENGVNAWEFRPNVENAELIKVLNKTEIEFLNDTQELSIQTNFPIPKINEVYYFESKIYDLPNPETTLISIGIATTPYPYFRLPGRNRYSIGYDSNGDRRYNQPFSLTEQNGQFIFPQLQRGDVVGCGVRTNSRTIFFTRNGKKLSESKIGGHVKFPKNLQLYPTIGSTNKCQVHVNLGQMGYVFIEGNVKKWGFGPLEANGIPPPLYTKFNKDVLLESSDLDPNDLNLRNGDFPPNFWEIIATPAEFTDVEDEDDADITLHSLQEQGLISGDFIIPPANPPGYNGATATADDTAEATAEAADDDDTAEDTAEENADAIALETESDTNNVLDATDTVFDDTLDSTVT